MLVKALARPLINNIYKVPTRSTSAIVGKRTNNVSVTVRKQQHIKKFLILLFSSPICISKKTIRFLQLIYRFIQLKNFRNCGKTVQF